ncbi:TolC family outer membrane protein [Comamonas endophytica]|uniref:TolC family outer membrane protein n=1 Tax=Comamonas endophytica TaxID=2949090 RepID=A0ABY6GCH3_9BURK|nr:MULTISPECIES: TolC family outer membrane protein [unclassified Acidovorax]MCD2514010.1 TolC family outer membrane protein [Acidovorax sp. D4N7]UYG52000.1 TolC family outer membrane protein [Acidovorax sp. 5MLIR]
MKFKQIAQVAASLGLASGAAGSWAQDTLTMQQADAQGLAVQKVVEKVLMTHPEIQVRFQDLNSSLEGQNVARGALRPQVTAQGWVGREWRSNTEAGADSDWNRNGWNLQLRQLIFDGFTTNSGVRQLGFEKLSKFYDLRATTESLANEAVGAYLDVQRYREMERLARDNFTTHQVTLGQLRERQQSGVGRGVDLEQSSGRVSLAQSNLMTETNNLNDVMQRYRRVVGEYPAADLAPVPEVTDRLIVPAVTRDFGDALRANPQLLSKQALFQAAQAGQKAAQGAHLPKVEFVASTGRDREQSTPAYWNQQSSRVQVMLTYNLSRGGADEARVRQTIAQGYAAQDLRDYTCRNLAQEMSITWNNIARLRQQTPFLQEHVLSTSKVRVAYQQQFRIGQRSLLDLLNTENELFDAQRALVNAQYDLKKAEYQWLALSSEILPVLGLAQPHSTSRPDEQQALTLPDDMLRSCNASVPDTTNLMPVSATVSENVAPVQTAQAAQPLLKMTRRIAIP